MSREDLGPSTVLVVRDEVLSGDFEDEAVLLDLRNGIYYGLESVGARIWQLLKRPVRVSQVEQTILAEYAVEPARCRADLQEFLGELLDRGLIRIAGAEVTPSADAGPL